MTEFVYKLNLPPITDLLVDAARQKVLDDSGGPFHRSFKARDVLKKEAFIKQIPWSNLIIFYKPNFLGTIHADDNSQLRSLNEPCIWGINFIHGGSTVMEYWNPEDITESTTVADAVGTYNLKFETDKPACKIYYMQPGAYLVNASQIHRVRGIGKRFAAVLRPNSSLGFTWEKITERFNDLIVDWPGHEESNLDL